MSDEKAKGIIRSSEYHLPEGFSVEFTYDGARINCAWFPDVPRQSRRILKAYQSARSRFMRTIEPAGVNWKVMDI